MSRKKDELQEFIEFLRDVAELTAEDNPLLAGFIDEAHECLKDAVEALEKYADPRTYARWNRMSWESCDIAKDRGERARKVLEKMRERLK